MEKEIQQGVYVAIKNETSIEHHQKHNYILAKKEYEDWQPQAQN